MIKNLLFDMGGVIFRQNSEEAFRRFREAGVDTDEYMGEYLAPALPANDGKQTPMRGHPVFIAQHATATCCRGCLAKWHNIPQGEALSEEQQRYIVTVIYHWLVIQMNQP